MAGLFLFSGTSARCGRVTDSDRLEASRESRGRSKTRGGGHDPIWQRRGLNPEDVRYRKWEAGE